MLTYVLLSIWIATATGPTPVDLSTYPSMTACEKARAAALANKTHPALDATCVTITHAYRPR